MYFTNLLSYMDVIFFFAIKTLVNLNRIILHQTCDSIIVQLKQFNLSFFMVDGNANEYILRQRLKNVIYKEQFNVLF